VHGGTRDAAALAETIFVPRAVNYTGVDAVLGVCKALVNFTINPAHDLKRAHGKRKHEGPAALAGARLTCFRRGGRAS
jgi:hypothetical protein